jgi:hypothetical protein
MLIPDQLDQGTFRNFDKSNPRSWNFAIPNEAWQNFGEFRFW